VTADDRWMIRGVDKTLQRAVKRRAKIEGLSIGGWVKRALTTALRDDAGGAPDVTAWLRRLDAVEARMEAIERFQFDLADRMRQDVRAAKPKRANGP